MLFLIRVWKLFGVWTKASEVEIFSHFTSWGLMNMEIEILRVEWKEMLKLLPLRSNINV